MNETIAVDNNSQNENFKCRLTTPSGVVYSEKDTGSPITMHGYLPHFVQYLHESGQLDDFIKNCPLTYTSNNAPKVKDVLGTTILSILSGHTRYCHAASLYGDTIAAEMLGIDKIVSHDSATRGLDKMHEDEVHKWLRGSYQKVYEPLLRTPYILDLDPTVKVLYGHQEGAEFLFQVFGDRYEKASTIITTNRPYKEWTKTFANDSVMTSAVLDRIMHHCETVIVEGSSYRMKNRIETQM